ncbi:dienelactone hydrolase family protein [Acetobacter cibinongensis]|uniref:Carboxymethylenebutenolidase n=1 Tax=Acetobacter cibinongensis TaxID=146475 RepID=A0A1Z5YW10_9PROT|nr:dienelactone hydrolase family protein [Acetobacter cibinongensis]OUJ03154.1 carboxymethylenebutenolidase [Acetobacter cibinongensis]
MGQSITLTAQDGHRFSAYEAGQQNPYALVVLQEIFGVNDHIRAVCDEFAAQGFHVIAPALFDRAAPDIVLGYDKAGVDAGIALRAQIPLEKTLLDLTASALALKHKKTGIIGYCWGGTLAWEAACKLDIFAAAVGWYGAGIAAARNQTPHCPVELHFGGEDHSIPHMDVTAIRDAQHGFGCAARPSFNPDAYALAQQRSIAFLESYLRV